MSDDLRETIRRFFASRAAKSPAPAGLRRRAIEGAVQSSWRSRPWSRVLTSAAIALPVLAALAMLAAIHGDLGRPNNNRAVSVATPSGSPTTEGTPTSEAITPPPVEASPAPSPTASPTRRPGPSPLPTPRPSPTPSSGSGCGAQVAVTVQTDKSHYSTGETVTFTLTARNNGTMACSYQANSCSNPVLVHDAGGNLVWRSTPIGVMCSNIASTMAPGQSVSYTYMWNQQANVGSQTQVPPGTYSAIGYWSSPGTPTSAPVSFTIS